MSEKRVDTTRLQRFARAYTESAVFFAALDLELPTPVVEPVETAVLKDVVVAATTPLPGLIVDHDHLARNRVMELQSQVRHSVDEKVIHEELAA